MWFPSLGGAAGGGASGTMTMMPSAASAAGATGGAPSRVRSVPNGQMAARITRARTQHGTRPSQSAIRTGAGYIRLKTSNTGT